MGKRFIIEGATELPYPMEAALDWALLIGDRVRLLIEGGWCVLLPGVTPRERRTVHINLSGARSEFGRGDHTVLVTYFDHGELALIIGDSGGLLMPKALKVGIAPIVSLEVDVTMKDAALEWYTFESGDLTRLFEELQPFSPPTLLKKK